MSEKNEPKKDLSDAEIERILNEYRKSKMKSADEDDEKKNKNPKQEKEIPPEEIFSQRIDKIFDFFLMRFGRPIIFLLGKYVYFHNEIYYPLWKRMIKFVTSHRICPYVLDYAYGTIHSLIILILMLPFVFLLGLVVTPADRGIQFVIDVSVGYVCAIEIVIASLSFVCSPVLWLYIFDCLTFKRKIRRKVELRIIRIQITNPFFRGGECPNYLSYFFMKNPVPCYFLFVPLKKNHIPMTSPEKKPPKFYQGGWDYMGNRDRSVRFIITKKKSKQIDKLFEKVPSAEFEISYLPFSRILREIRPIEGYNYPEGVSEICERINKMYP